MASERQPPPTARELETRLGSAHRHWQTILEHAEGAADGVHAEWKYYGAKHGWQLKLVHRRRALLYLVPHDGSFLAGMALPEASMEAVRAADLPEALLTSIENARVYREGRPARVEVRTQADVGAVRTLLDLKLEI